MFDLVQKIRVRDKNAITLLYNLYGKKLYGYAVSKWNVNEDDAWDLVYKTIYRIIDVIENYRFETESKFMGFIFTIFTNYLRNHFRDVIKKRPIEHDLDENSLGNIPVNYANDVNNNPKLVELESELLKLDDWQRILLLMKAQDYSYDEISRYVDKPVDQLKVYYMRLKKQLGDKLSVK